MAVKFKAALFYQESIVFYSVYCVGEDFYKAKLDDCNVEGQPPALLALYKSENYWESDCNNIHIVNELGAAIEQQKYKPSEM
ncbi:hypothetical protein OCK74_02225 [Chitinophagaceae bacterium LB-8]|uniref:Uncharacterized protein n=1 Tax=Paraflavisolibacter caeni TaxID=2982496 RepID=A0A9X2XUE8_9BACT|nr:hypothetical protein [Paraflavisolibacter caeni]MCU7547908.1 hypothetical protein [Paraflavisolibacter caeni]